MHRPLVQHPSMAYTAEPAEELADLPRRRRQAPDGPEKAFFASSGSEAVEAALKLARQYHYERGPAPEAAPHRQEGVVPDVVAVAKGLGEGSPREGSSPPFMTTEEQLEEVCRVFREAVEEIEAETL
ncbi:hypothetical protein LY76DRAFT_648559 [Colletotrichum caudatum]|nr:hypothetical protein LY76DRAFT_648559 [Colletotrichum caudatum]